MVSDTLNVAGVTIPGIPFVIIGHNARVAWGLTNVGADVQDFFVEQLDASRERYRSGDNGCHWRCSATKFVCVERASRLRSRCDRRGTGRY